MTLTSAIESRVSLAEENSDWEDVVSALTPLYSKGDLDDNDVCRLGVAYWHLMKMKQAKELFEKVLEKNPSCARAWSGMASVAVGKSFLSGKKNYTSLDALQKAAELEPTNKDYVFAYTSELSSLKEYATEAAFFEKILKNHPDAVNYLYLSDCYTQLKQWGKARDLFSILFNLIPKWEAPTPDWEKCTKH